MVPNKRVFDYDARESSESNVDVSNADEDQAPNTDNCDGGNTTPEIVHGPPTRPMAVLDADDLIGRTYLNKPYNTGNDKDADSRAP